MVFLRSFDNYFSANLVLGRLSNDGIRCTLFDEKTVTTDPLLSNAIGGIKLMVHEADEGPARNLLANYDQEILDQSFCEQCGASQFTRIIKPAPLDLETRINRFFSRAIHTATITVYHCENCHYETKVLPGN